MDYTELYSFLDKLNTEYLTNEPLFRHTSFKIGGNADVFVKIRSEQELCDICSFCNKKYKILVIGNGSNLLVSDDGYKGVVLHIGHMFADIKLIDDNTILCNAGAPLSTVCNFALSKSLGGLEFAYGIPGTLGGAVYMNAGAYGGEMSDAVVKVNYVTPDGKRGFYDASELDFGYRHSVFSGSDKIITSAVLKLCKKPEKEISDLMKENMIKRKTKQPLEFPSAGSVFKRPEGYFAGALIQDCDLKGYTIGGAQVSEKHAGFIINVGGATCSDVLALIDTIKKKVLDKFGVSLETEIKYIS